MNALSWDPVRDGETYCAPACGRGCRVDEFLAAHQLGLALRRQLGRTWDIEVFENLGWFVTLHSADRRLEVSPSEVGYTAFLGGHEFSAAAKTPLAAVAAVVALGKAAAARYAAMVEGL